MTLKKPAMASRVNGVRQRLDCQELVVALSQIARTLVELLLRRLEQKKQAGGGDFTLMVVVLNL